jgi:hypothetical protein
MLGTVNNADNQKALTEDKIYRLSAKVKSSEKYMRDEMLSRTKLAIEIKR